MSNLYQIFFKQLKLNTMYVIVWLGKHILSTAIIMCQINIWRWAVGLGEVVLSSCANCPILARHQVHPILSLQPMRTNLNFCEYLDVLKERYLLKFTKKGRKNISDLFVSQRTHLPSQISTEAKYIQQRK
jgi:hypothetical protein